MTLASMKELDEIDPDTNECQCVLATGQGTLVRDNSILQISWILELSFYPASPRMRRIQTRATRQNEEQPVNSSPK